MAPPLVANASDLLPIPKGSRCEITPQVRTIAQRTQARMFQRTGLFFNQATFQVPNTVEEAFENMRLGTTDLDRDRSESTDGITDLYLLSWSNTQFFSAQMAALGFRFISCNLRRKPGLGKPPHVEQWLRLERFSGPLPRPSMSAEPNPNTSTPNNTNKPAPKSAPQSTTPSAPRPQKRPAPSDPPSDQHQSPARKLQRITNGTRLPAQPLSAASDPPSNSVPHPKPNGPTSTQREQSQKTSTRAQPPNKNNHAPVPIIDLT